MHIFVGSGLDGAIARLIAHVRKGCPFLNEQTPERVTEVVKPETPQPCALKDEHKLGVQ